MRNREKSQAGFKYRRATPLPFPRRTDQCHRRESSKHIPFGNLAFLYSLRFRAERQYVPPPPPPPPPKESLFSTKLPSGEEQRINARVFHDEAVVPVRSAMKVTQASPLRIRTIDSHFETATTAAETEKMSTLKRGEELKKVMEEHRREVEPGSRKRKLRKTKKSGKLSKKNKSLDMDSTEMPSSEKEAEEYRKTVRRMPETVSSTLLD
ncbi:hypothetical protein ANCDUO_00852 [Ancylostoma duodenale]|uniref:Uncharacterized protein n=1 Tax=Ancylostoma duodenale TaxID=51022 RepID=A0A0C2HAX5_9BILA|nr:hypothetical protein ANCDUO_00852 [Ancylostoma duodenale]